MFYHPQPATRNTHLAPRNPYPEPRIQHPASRIQHPVSSIRHPASGIRYQELLSTHAVTVNKDKDQALNRIY